MNKITGFLSQLMPLVLLAGLIGIFILGLLIFSYLLLIGTVIALGLFIISWCRNKFFPANQVIKRANPIDPQSTPGRIIEHNDHL
jgi:hypothetical protein